MRKNISLNIISGSVLLLILLTSGCESLPPGRPPEGPIVTERQKSGQQLYSIDDGINLMTTSLTAAAIRHGLNNIAVLKLFNDHYAKQVFRATANILNWQSAACLNHAPKYILTSKFSRHANNMLWKMTLLSGAERQLLWQQQLEIKQPASHY